MSAHIKVTKATKVKSNTKQAIDILRGMILDKSLAPGSFHLESNLAILLKMSRTPIREAALVLEAQGLLEVRPRHGVHILALSPTDMAEIYEILTELESLSAELAASKRHREKEFGKAERAIARMDQALISDQREAWVKADDVFHRELVRLGGNTRIAKIVEMYHDQVKRARAITLYMRPLPVKSNDDHRNVLEAIRSGNPQKARELHRIHRFQAKVLLVGLLEKYNLRHM